MKMAATKVFRFLLILLLDAYDTLHRDLHGEEQLLSVDEIHGIIVTPGIITLDLESSRSCTMRQLLFS